MIKWQNKEESELTSPINLRLTKRQKRILSKIANETKLDLSKVIRLVLDNYIDENTTELN